MRRVADRLRSEQAGVTLVELLVAMVIGLIVTSASLAVLGRATTVSYEVADRQETVQRGRLAMEAITRQLRSQVCLGDSAEPISYGDGATLTFYADLSNGGTNVQRRRLTFVPATGTTPGRITEEVFAGTGTYPDLTYGSTPTSSRALLSEVRPTRAGTVDQPLFRYYAFQPGSPTGDLQELPTPLSAENASRTVMVRIAFVVLPERTVPRDFDSTTLQDDVYVRLADPTRPLEGPRCL